MNRLNPPGRGRRALAVLALTSGLALAAAPGSPAPVQDRAAPPTATLAHALERAGQLLELGDLERARAQIQRALERDRRSIAAWHLRERWAVAAEDRDDQVYALHQQLSLAVRQELAADERAAIEARLVAVDPLARDLATLRDVFVERLEAVAAGYEQEDRPHSAIAAHKEVLALDPSRAASEAAIERLAASPDPSLAADAKPVDLFADVTAEWIAEHDARTATWSERAKRTRENYVTQTDAGYEVLVRAAEAMEQMNAFYRQFFAYGTEQDPGGVPRIDVLIFKDRAEYLKLGSGPPVEWSAGQFTGGSVETYVGEGGFESMTGTLFHEAAHQFVSLATNASGWLNEGLASFFEGTRILANGTVLMNLPANHRLFPLATRMEAGTMEHVNDGFDPANPNAEPTKAPSFRIVLEGRYPWGPPWYAPTWGLVYFLYNYQDPVDGRFLYRAAFRQFMDSLSSRLGDAAVEHFEEVVLANPTARTKGVDFGSRPAAAAPATVAELEAVWRDWILALRDEQSGQREVVRPWLDWARYAVERKEFDVAFEHFERGLLAAPEDVELLLEFGTFLAERRADTDRATKLVLRAVQLLEAAEPVDEKQLAAARKRLSKYDPEREEVERLHGELRGGVLSLVQRYLSQGLHLQAMDLAWRFGNQLGEPELFELYARGLEASGKDLALWQLAYNERDLEGWVAAGSEGWTPDGPQLRGQLGNYQEDLFDYRFLAYDTVTSGDFSLEAEVKLESGVGAFGGLVFGRKSDTTFHALVFFPPRKSRAETAGTGYVDLTSFYGEGNKVWRHSAVQVLDATGTSVTTTWHRLRVDVVGDTVDVWFDGRFQASQSFSNRDVLRGSLGLFQGPGQVEFRDVRYLSRAAGDPAGAIERERRIADLVASGQGLDGSFLGYLPPFPKVARFAQGEPLSDFEPLRRRPTLLLLWSIDQNELIPLQDWLAALERRFGPLGLQFLSVVSPNDDGAIDAYLREHPFPGRVAVDSREGYGIGLTYEAYSVDRFQLPRVLLLDLDGKVVWEGDPGFSIGAGYDPGVESFVDAPLAELIERRQLATLVPWRTRYDAELRPRLAAGEFLAVLPELRAAEGFEASSDPSVAEAQSILGAVRAVASSPAPLAEVCSREGAEPALAVALDWGSALGIERTPRERKALSAVLESRAAKDWPRALQALTKFTEQHRRRPESADPAELLGQLEALGGLFPRRLAEQVRSEFAAGGLGALEALSNRAAGLPAQWLAAEYFAW
jgi:Tfp pilus assembly protein PilF